MYQWTQIQRRDGPHGGGPGGRRRGGRHPHHGGPEVDYVKDWHTTQINSATFHEPFGHENPHDMPYIEKITTGDKVKYGGYILSESQKNLLNNKVPLAYTKEMVEKGVSATSGLLKSLGYEDL